MLLYVIFINRPTRTKIEVKEPQLAGLRLCLSRRRRPVRGAATAGHCVCLSVCVAGGCEGASGKGYSNQSVEGAYIYIQPLAGPACVFVCENGRGGNDDDERSSSMRRHSIARSRARAPGAGARSKRRGGPYRVRALWLRGGGHDSVVPARCQVASPLNRRNHTKKGGGWASSEPRSGRS